MSDITIGIPRALYYYKFKNLWIPFFKELGVNVLISPVTDESILSKEFYELHDICLPLKIYIGHVNYLLDKVDYIFVPRITSYNECPCFRSLYDVINSIFDAKLLDYNIDDKISEEEAFLKLGKKLGFGKEFILNAYNVAKREEYKQNKINYLLQQKRLENDDKKILLISQEYIYEDEIILKKVINPIKDKGIKVIYSNNINPDNYNDINSYKKAIFNNIKKLQNRVDGIVNISTKPCISYVSKEFNKKYINIRLDNLNFDENKLYNFINDIRNGEKYE